MFHLDLDGEVQIGQYTSLQNTNENPLDIYCCLPPLAKFAPIFVEKFLIISCQI